MGYCKALPVNASGIRLIGKETERGWEQDDDISTLLPWLIQYDAPDSGAGSRLQMRLREIHLDVLEAATGLSRHTLVRARKGKRLHPRSLDILRRAALTGRK